MLVSIPTIFLLAASAAAQSTTTLCVAGQCLDGTSNISIGAVVSAAGSDNQFVLLPGAYPATTEPESLRTALGSGSSRLSYSPGFSPNGSSSSTSQSISFPLTIALQPGVLSTTSSLFRGQTKFTGVPASNAAQNETLGAKVPASGSLVMSDDVWAWFQSGDKRVVLWDSVADLAQLPSGLGQSEMTLVELQSTKCTPACSGNGICTAAGTCACPEGSGYTGSSCESCRDGFFGPQCLPCPEDCETCDGGATGTGKCLKPKAVGAPATCNCSNGVCDASGACACNEGWQDGSNGLKCSVCATGFFKAADGSCQVCENGCERCQDNTGTCTTCSSGLVVDGNDGRKCIIDTTGATRCPDGSFVNGGTCSLCSSACETCTGSGAGSCLRCARGTFKLNGQCVPTDAAGVCSGSKRVANTVKNTCDACPTNCSSCGITGFNAASSTFDQVQCTACIPGTYLSGGKCVAACPAGTFISKTDGFTCVTCDTSCETCVDDAKFCLTCSGSSLANAGTCGATCPAGTFQSDGACLPCHADCASCTGPGFDQCTTCNALRPALVASSTATGTGGRCMPTCGKAQYLDATTNRCQSCDSACSSCAGAGPNQCLACAGDNQILTGGSCAAAKCERGSSVIPGLGACLSALVAAPFVDNTPTESPTTPIPTGSPQPSSNGPRLVWWEILLMALGCAFIFLVILLLWRRRMRRKRAARTAQFAEGIKRRGFVARSVLWLGGIFGSRRAAAANHKDQDVDSVVAKMKAQEMERHRHEMATLDSRSRGAPSFVSQPQYEPQYDRPHYDVDEYPRSVNRTSLPSIYSQVTGVPRNGPEPRIPMRNADVPPMPREFRLSTFSEGTSVGPSVSQRGHAEPPRFYDPAPMQPQQHQYVTAPLQPLRQQHQQYEATPLQPQRTGSMDSYRSSSSGESERIRTNSNNSKNPFYHQ